MMIAGFILALYVGIYLMFVLPIIDLIKEAVNLSKGSEINTIVIGLAIGKMILAGVVGGICGAVLIIPGRSLMEG